MKKNFYMIAGFALLCFILTGSNVFAADVKIGFINMQEIIQQSTVGKKAGDEIRKIAEKKKDTITAMENELKKMKDDLDKQRSVVKESVFKEKESAFQKKYRDYQILVKDTQEELQGRDQEFAKKYIPEILKVVRAIGEKDKYTLVIDVASMPVPYYAKENDFSGKVVEEFNKAQSGKK
jgi:outer membrane protein